MNKFKEKIVKVYVDYKKFDEALKKEVENLTEKGNLFKKNSESVKDAEDMLSKGEELANLYTDTTIASSQLRMIFEHLIFLISLYNETNEEPLDEEIQKFYKDFYKYKTKNVFTIEKERLVPIDKELLDEARKQLKDSPIFKILNQN